MTVGEVFDTLGKKYKIRSDSKYKVFAWEYLNEDDHSRIVLYGAREENAKHRVEFERLMINSLKTCIRFLKDNFYEPKA